MDKFKIDSHKLIYHLDRVNDWLRGINIYPIYMEVSPAGTCNHRCVYCALDFMGYRSVFLDRNILKDRLLEMGSLGVKSIMYAGEGEPFLHKDIHAIIDDTNKAGIDVAITTNGVLFNDALADKILPNLKWIKVSINAGTRQTYAKVHRARPSDFDKVFRNMSYAARAKRQNGYNCALGMQIVLLPENSDEVFILAKKAKDIGMDYLAVKPYSQHPMSKTARYKDIKYIKFLGLAEKLYKLNDKRFNVIFRARAMKKWDNPGRNYKHCLALPFWAYIDSSGDVWACSIFLTEDRFRLGNINKDNFRRIWETRKRLNLVRWAQDELDTAKCRVNCRMDEANRFLWGLKHPPEHVNFI